MSEENSIDGAQKIELQQEKLIQADNPYLTNPLHGVGLKTVLEELITHYGFDILYAYLNINCFRSNPSLAASAKFLKKNDWAREKVEIFYLYQYKNLPKVSSEQFKLPARERIVPKKHKIGEPAVLSIEDGEQLQDKRSRNVANRDKFSGERKGSSREYNEQRNSANSKFGSSNSGYGNFKKKSQSDSPYKKPNDFGCSVDQDKYDNSPQPPKNPWGNFKGGK